jgi:tetratricopeptide (TPR) repeat protein
MGPGDSGIKAFRLEDSGLGEASPVEEVDLTVEKPAASANFFARSLAQASADVAQGTPLIQEFREMMRESRDALVDDPAPAAVLPTSASEWALGATAVEPSAGDSQSEGLDYLTPAPVDLDALLLEGAAETEAEDSGLRDFSDEFQATGEESDTESQPLGEFLGEFYGGTPLDTEVGLPATVLAEMDPAVTQIRTRLGEDRTQVSRETGHDYLRLAQHFARLRDRQTAIKYYETARQIFAGHAQQFMVGVTLNELGICHDDSGYLDAALQHYQEALEILGPLNNPEARARVLANMAEVYRQLQELPEAYRALRAAIDETNQNSDLSLGTAILNKMASLLIVLGQYSVADQIIRKNLRFYQHFHIPYGIAVCLSNLGHLYLTQGPAVAPQTRDHLQAAIRLKAEVGAEAEAVDDWIRLAKVHIQLRTPAEAEPCLLRALELVREYDLGKREAEVYLELGQYYRYRGDYAEAEAYLRLAGAEFQAYGRALEEMRTHLAVASLLLGPLGRPDDAIPLLGDAEAFFEEGGRWADVGDAALLASQYYTRIGDADSARAAAAKAAWAFNLAGHPHQAAQATEFSKLF